MISKTTPSFWRHYSALPAEIQRLADRAYERWQQSPNYPGLHFKPIQGFDDLWSVRVGRQHRALAHRRGKLVVWVWIGDHSDYDRLLK